MSSGKDLDENFGKALDFIRPRVDEWIKELLSGVEGLKLPPMQRDLIQGLTVETMLYNTMMPNDEIIAILAGIIQNISTRNSYGDALDWGKRSEIFDKYSQQK